MKKLSIIIPVYNEKKTIAALLRSLEALVLEDIEKEIIIIDDKSTDGTTEILHTYQQRHTIVFKDRNEGKGSAIRVGLQKASGDMAIIQDADLEYSPQEYPEILKPLLQERADVVYGSRFITSKPHRVLYFSHYLGNRLLTTLSNVFTNLNLTDMETCYKAFNRTAVDFLKERVSAKRFGIEPQITALIAKGRFRVYEVGISYFGRTYEEGKKINWKDGIAALWHIIKYNVF